MSMSATNEASVIDLTAMRRRLGADDELVREILGGFLIALPALRAQLAAAVAQRDTGARTRAAHALRGALLDVAAVPAAELARLIEFAADDCTDLLALLAAELDDVTTSAAAIVAMG